MTQNASERELRTEVVRYAKLLAAKDFAPGTSGNISARLDARRVLITPSGIGKGDLRTEDLVVVDMGGRRLSGRHAPTSESAMHRMILRARPDVQAVVHAHPATATGFACAGVALDQPLASEFIQALGCAPLAPYGTPGTEELPESLRGLVKDHDAILLANHGVVTFGGDLFDAFAKMELVEHYARILLVVRQLKREQPLREEEVVKLLEARARYFGLDKPPERQPRCPTRGTGAAPVAAPAGKGASRRDLERIIEEVLKKL
ncbi:MAG: class II aldolase/adducin family protein [Elusimicrobiota bacterium]